MFKHHAHGVQEIGHVAQHWDTLTYVNNTRRSILPKGAHPWAISISNITIQNMWLCVFALNHSNHIGCHKGVGDESAKILSNFDFGKPRWPSLDISCAKLCIMPLTKYWWMSKSKICGYGACCMKMLEVHGQWFCVANPQKGGTQGV